MGAHSTCALPAGAKRSVEQPPPFAMTTTVSVTESGHACDEIAGEVENTNCHYFPDAAASCAFCERAFARRS
jgi:hypothetical protein